MIAPSDRICGVVFIGASQFSKEGLDNPAFATSKARIAEVMTTDYILARSVEHLDIFDQNRLPPDVIDDVHGFLVKHRNLTDLIVYYCGHGGFLPDQSFYLTLRATREGREATTGLQVKQLAIDLEDLLFGMRTYLVLDCCFAAAAVKAWMLDRSLPTLIADQTEAVFPRTGTALFAAASEKTAALAPQGHETTLFSGHLAEALRTGIKRGPAELSLADLAESVRGRISREPVSRKVMPSLHVPRQEEGDVSRMPLVRNVAAARDFSPEHAGPPETWEASRYRANVQVIYRASGFELHQVPIPHQSPLSPTRQDEPEEADPPAKRLFEPSRRIVNCYRPTLARTALGVVAAGALCAAVLVMTALYWPPISPPVSGPSPDLPVDDGVNEAGGGPAGIVVQGRQGPGPNYDPPSATPKIDPSDASALACSALIPVGGAGGPSSPFAIRPSFASDVEPLRAIAFSPDGKKFATAGDDGMVRMWDAWSFQLDAVLEPRHRNKARSVAFSKDGSLVGSASWDGTVQVWNTVTRELKKKFVASPLAKQFAVAFDSEKPAKYVASGGEDGIINIWSLREGAASVHKPGHKNASSEDRRTVHSLSYAPNSSSDFVSGGFDGRINYYYFANDRADVASVDTLSARVFRVAYAPRDERVVSAGTDGKLSLWLAKDKKITFVRPYLGYNKERVTAVAWSQDGKWLVSGAGDGNPMRLWDVNNGAKSLRQYAGHKKDVEGVAFHPGSSRIVSVSEDGTMKVWDADSSSELFTVVPFKDGQYLAYTPSGCYTGPVGVDRHFKLLSGGKETALTKGLETSLFVPGGFGELIAKR